MNKDDILRYMRTSSKTTDERILSLVDEAIKKVNSTVNPKTIYKVLDCETKENGVLIGDIFFKSQRLSQTMSDCTKCAIIAVTLGIECDTLIAATSRTNIALSSAIQAVAADKVEEVCDSVEETIKEQYGCSLRQRYSPGYFDLDISSQKELFSLMEITKRIGITLTDNYEMVPMKSVSAIIGMDFED